MKVFKFQLKIKIDDFTTYSNNVVEITEATVEHRNYPYITRRIKDDRNFSWEEFERLSDRKIDEGQAE